MKITISIKKGIRGAWFWLWGHFFALFLYKNKYLQGRWFDGRLGGLCAVGWEWVCHDALGRIKNRENKDCKFPVSQHCRILFPENIEFHVDDLNNFQSFGIYYQAIGKIRIGRGTYIGPNVGIITANHVIGNLDEHEEPKDVCIGKKCWIGMNAVILPGVILGENTIVGAGAVVTRSFEEGNCVIAGNPAVKIKNI